MEGEVLPPVGTVRLLIFGIGGSLSHRIHGTGIFTYIWLIVTVNVGKYTIHGSYGYSNLQLSTVGG